MKTVGLEEVLSHKEVVGRAKNAVVEGSRRSLYRHQYYTLGNSHTRGLVGEEVLVPQSDYGPRQLS